MQKALEKSKLKKSPITQGRKTEKIKTSDKMVRVKKGTGDTVNGDYSGSTEEITLQTARLRRNKVLVIKGTGDIVNADYPGLTEQITRNAARQRARKAIARKKNLVGTNNAEDDIIIIAETSLEETIGRERKRRKPAAVHNPVLQFNEQEFMEVVRILRVTIAADNGACLTQDFIHYLRTGKKPALPSGSAECSMEHFQSWLEKKKKTIRVKKETGSYSKSVRSVTHSTVDRNTLFGAQLPQREVFVEEGGWVNLTLPANDDYTSLRTAEFPELENTLKLEAQKNGLGLSFGLINIARCGNHADEAMYLFAYHATADQVVYVDPQTYNGLTGEGNPLFFKLYDMFVFASQVKRITIDVFGVDVFYLPMLNPALQFQAREAFDPDGTDLMQKIKNSQ